MKILMTGFDPFGGEAVNPSWEAVKLVSPPRDCTLQKVQIPTVFGTSIQVLSQAMEQFQPDAVICVGQAGGRKAVTPERVAINLMDATIADNEGFLAQDQPICPGGENALFSTLPVKAMVSAIQQAGIPGQLSYTAGTFVCNQLLYGALRLCADRYPGTRAGFIHVPFLPEQVLQRPELPSLPLAQITAALEAAISVL